ncbi:unnamed protein product [Didymodactylos carnosus]|uniref:Uncharacterized protein n=1 Tax=Didymodactylos carnosus TaxID=1234261 RepID=A0A814XFE0_9BILA|nr:unnamed protein product [Didymodactylos carnosus]CAF1368357.1 unnamed protein product [Didymodactylos carnosus]CAF3979586.1 unnamed protein product [Didymodactylos carnosus]CAF4177748.1 unnamed protein product [Didymodactylos carnosus]
MDELIQVLEDVDPAAKASYYKILTSEREFDNSEKGKNGVEERDNEEDSEYDDDEDYEFELSDESEDNDGEAEEDEGNDTNEQNKHHQSSSMKKEVENQYVLHVDVSIQTPGELDYIFFDMQVLEQQNMELRYTCPIDSFYNRE